MTRLAAVLVASLALSLTAASAQVQAPSTPAPTPAAAALMEDLPVSLATGSPGVAIPLLSVPGRTGALPVTLQHHGGAIRPTETASWVGLGWSLSAGGAITRSVRSRPDDGPYGYRTNGLSLLQMYSERLVPPSQFDDPSVTINPVALFTADDFANLKSVPRDTEPDVFFYSVAGRSGTFYVDPRTSPATFFTVPASDVKITATTGAVANVAGSPIASWTITFEDGTAFEFGRSATAGDAFDRTEQDGVWHVSAWHLTRVTPPGGSDAITLTYAPVLTIEEFGPMFQQNKAATDIQGAYCPAFGTSNGWSATKHHTRDLATIESASHRATFVTGARSDLDHEMFATPTPQGRRLDRIDLDVRSTPTGTWTRDRSVHFAYDTFTPATQQTNLLHQALVAPNLGKRLKLLSVQEKGSDGTTTLPAYQFDYYPGGLLSRYNLNVDFWGFPTGRTGATTYIPAYTGPNPSQPGADMTLAGANRTPATTAAPLLPGALKSVTYPSGGTTTITYEPNRYYDPPSAGSGGNTLTKSANVFSSGDDPTRTSWKVLTTTFTTGTIATGSNIPPQSISVTGAVHASCAPDGPCVLITIRDAATNALIHYTQSPSYVTTLQSQLQSNRSYTLEAKLGWRSSSSECATTSCSAPFAVNVSWTEPAPPPSPSASETVGGGLRVASLTQSAGVTGVPDRVRTFAYSLENDPTTTSGQLSALPRFLVPNLRVQNCFFALREASPRVALGLNGLGSVYYATVRERLTDASGTDLGSTVHRFTLPTTPIPHVYGQSTNDFGPTPFDALPRTTWLNGLPTNVSVRDAAGAEVQSAATSYRRYDLMNTASAGFHASKYRRVLGLRMETIHSQQGGLSTTYYSWYEIVATPVAIAQETVTSHN